MAVNSVAIKEAPPTKPPSTSGCENISLALAALTITSLRESFVDFTEPYLNLGISILYKV